MLSLFLKLVLLFLSCFATLCKTCNQIDKESLLSIKLNIYSPTINWTSSVDCCLWEGIECDANGRVTHLQLPGRDLSGSISPSIGNLTHLSHLNLSHNHLSGPVPHHSCEFPSSLSSKVIRLFDLSGNNLQGTIPSSFFQLSAVNLESFNVSKNSFTGLIPSLSWTETSCILRILDFSNNDFTGPIPPGLGNCSRLQVFRAACNFISGSLPDDIYAATSLEELSLHVNSLSGPISNSIVNLTSLIILQLYSNNLTGFIPQDIGKLTNLTHLYLHVNNLSGSLPPSMKNCINLIKLNLRNNKLEGDLSAFNFSMLRHLRTIDLGNNNFTGSFPSTLYSCKSLTAVRLSRNNIEGEISPEIVALESLSYLSLAQNRLTNATAAIKILTGCKNLSVLFLCKNFKGEMIPDDITFSYAFPNLQVLALSKSQFQGQVPSWISNLRKLQFLDLSLNQITGSIPGWLGTMTSLFYIDLSYNLLSGEFPKELGGLPMLVSELQAAKKIGASLLELPLFIPPNINASNEEYYSLLSLPPSIFLQNNSLTGSIPIEIGQLHFLQLLNLSYNKFSGNIPNQISKLTNLERLDLSGNNLSGEIPASFSGLYFLSEFSVANNNLHGLIPSGGQFLTFSISNFEGNPGLCGDIIEISCSIQTRTNNNPVPSPSESSKKGACLWTHCWSCFRIYYWVRRWDFLPNSCI
ncbi:hypothetical protein Pint_25938 [Pistacia integerrima]|uniref:Uncharacterized protein n=1 Tax=Pistacia integerrima TaxID=434235 RepID=A0ACC0YCV7_9ROSI|nr:hypothetical protein Pint_25938 [Pistacia integerrima]